MALTAERKAEMLAELAIMQKYGKLSLGEMIERLEAAESEASALRERVAKLDDERDSLRTIAKIIRYWLAWDADQRRVSDRPPQPDNHIVIPPTWPTRGQFENWAAVLERVAALAPAPPEPDTEETRDV